MLDHEKHFVPSTPEAEGIDPEGIRKFIAGCLDKGSDLHAVLLIRHGKQAFSALTMSCRSLSTAVLIFICTPLFDLRCNRIILYRSSKAPRPR